MAWSSPAAGEAFTRGDARTLDGAVRSAVAAGAADTTAVIEALEGPLRAQADVLPARGADMPEIPTARLADEAALGLRHPRLLNHHREIALIGARRAELDGAGERGGWTEDASRVVTLLSAIRQLERAGRPAPSTNWTAALRAEVPIPPLADRRSAR